MRACCCELAGTRACIGCSNNHWQEVGWGIDNRFYPTAPIPNDSLMGIILDLQKRIQKLEESKGEKI